MEGHEGQAGGRERRRASQTPPWKRPATSLTHRRVYSVGWPMGRAVRKRCGRKQGSPAHGIREGPLARTRVARTELVSRQVCFEDRASEDHAQKDHVHTRICAQEDQALKEKEADKWTAAILEDKFISCQNIRNRPAAARACTNRAGSNSKQPHARGTLTGQLGGSAPSLAARIQQQLLQGRCLHACAQPWARAPASNLKPSTPVAACSARRRCTNQATASGLVRSSAQTGCGFHQRKKPGRMNRPGASLVTK